MDFAQLLSQQNVTTTRGQRARRGARKRKEAPEGAEEGAEQEPAAKPPAIRATRGKRGASAVVPPAGLEEDAGAAMAIDAEPIANAAAPPADAAPVAPRSTRTRGASRGAAAPPSAGPGPMRRSNRRAARAAAIDVADAILEEEGEGEEEAPKRRRVGSGSRGRAAHTAAPTPPASGARDPTPHPKAPAPAPSPVAAPVAAVEAPVEGAAEEGVVVEEHPPPEAGPAHVAPSCAEGPAPVAADSPPAEPVGPAPFSARRTSPRAAAHATPRPLATKPPSPLAPPASAPRAPPATETTPRTGARDLRGSAPAPAPPADPQPQGSTPAALIVSGTPPPAGAHTRSTRSKSRLRGSADKGAADETTPTLLPRTHVGVGGPIPEPRGEPRAADPPPTAPPSSRDPGPVPAPEALASTPLQRLPSPPHPGDGTLPSSGPRTRSAARLGTGAAALTTNPMFEPRDAADPAVQAILRPPAHLAAPSAGPGTDPRASGERSTGRKRKAAEEAVRVPVAPPVPAAPRASAAVVMTTSAAPATAAGAKKPRSEAAPSAALAPSGSAAARPIKALEAADHARREQERREEERRRRQEELASKRQGQPGPAAVRPTIGVPAAGGALVGKIHRLPQGGAGAKPGTVAVVAPSRPGLPAAAAPASKALAPSAPSGLPARPPLGTLNGATRPALGAAAAARRLAGPSIGAMAAAKPTAPIPKPAGSAGLNTALPSQLGAAKGTSTPSTAAAAPPPAPYSYEISPFRDDSDAEEDEDRPKKPVPDWARGPKLHDALKKQRDRDPEAVFGGRFDATCDLEALFGPLDMSRPRKRDPSRRTSSGDWTLDRLTQLEEVAYKKSMGFIPPAGPGGA